MSRASRVLFFLPVMGGLRGVFLDLLAPRVIQGRLPDWFPGGVR